MSRRGCGCCEDVHPFCECEIYSQFKFYLDVQFDSGTHYFRMTNFNRNNPPGIYKFDGDDMDAAVGGTYSLTTYCLQRDEYLLPTNPTCTLYRQTFVNSYPSCPDPINPTTEYGTMDFAIAIASRNNQISGCTDNIVGAAGSYGLIVGGGSYGSWPFGVAFCLPRSCEDPLELPYSETKDIVLGDNLGWRDECPLPTPAGTCGTVTFRIEFEDVS